MLETWEIPAVEATAMEHKTDCAKAGGLRIHFLPAGRRFGGGRAELIFLLLRLMGTQDTSGLSLAITLGSNERSRNSALISMGATKRGIFKSTARFPHG